MWMRRSKDNNQSSGKQGDRENVDPCFDSHYVNTPDRSVSNTGHTGGYAATPSSPSPDMIDYSNRYYSQNYQGAANRSAPSSTSPVLKSMFQQERSPSATYTRPQQATGESVDHRIRPQSALNNRNSYSRSSQTPFNGGHYAPPSTQFPQSVGGTTIAPPQDTHMNNNFYHQQGQLPASSYNKPNVASVTLTPSSQHDPYAMYTPQVSISQSQSSSSQRRPAYLLHRDLVIGKGSYGQVCIASRGEAEGYNCGVRGKRRKYACKCVVLRNDAKYIAKLQEEVNVLREVRGHENIIRLYDVFCVDNELFIITELGRGGDLFHLLTTHPKHGVTESYAAKTVAQMLSAVAFLHSRSICHRDLKLENWVLESGRDVWSPLKLIDFGLSTHFTPGHRLSRVVGSSYYVAPEVLKKSYTEACDMWSLGVIVYMLLSGAPPFYGKNDDAIKASIVQGVYSFPTELFRDVSRDATDFVETLLSYDIEYRCTAEQSLHHPWLAVNCDPEILQRAKDGVRGFDVIPMEENGLDPMQY